MDGEGDLDWAEDSQCIRVRNLSEARDVAGVEGVNSAV